MERRAQFNLGYLVFALLAMLLVQHWWQQAQTPEVVPYSEFEKMLAEGRGARLLLEKETLAEADLAALGRQPVLESPAR